MHPSHQRINSDLLRPLMHTSWKFYLLVAFFGAIVLTAVSTWLAQTYLGFGVTGIRWPVYWGFYVTSFVFWIGISHAGTLISAILRLVNAGWRRPVTRCAEVITVFALMIGALFPIIHLGRPWLAFWLFPYPSERLIWPNFRSPLVWDFFAISTYFTISLMFWYVGLIPDLATVRDRARAGLGKRLLSWFSLGWNGSYRVWQRYEIVYLLLAGLATPLVVSVHTIVSWDFATSVIPGWHATIFPPYFVAGAIFSGMAMVLTLMIIARATMRLERYITRRHVDVMSKLVIATGGMVALAYGTEFFMALYSANQYEQFVFMNRALGPFSWAYWTMVSCNVIAPQLLWFTRVRRHLGAVFAVSIFVNIGMWFERFTIIVTSLHRDYLPSSWADYAPTSIEVATLAGSVGLFFTCFLIFCRFIPVIAMSEVKGVIGTPSAGATGQPERPPERLPALAGMEA